jgi:hypothetical protein
VSTGRIRDGFLVQQAHGVEERMKMNILLEFSAKIDAVTTDIELASFSYGVGRILRRSRRGSMRRGRGERVES